MQDRIPNIRFHDLRHTFVTMLLQDGEKITAVSNIVRHNKTSTTVNIYSHVIPGAKKEVANRIENLLFNNA